MCAQAVQDLHWLNIGFRLSHDERTNSLFLLWVVSVFLGRGCFFVTNMIHRSWKINLSFYWLWYSECSETWSLLPNAMTKSQYRDFSLSYTLLVISYLVPFYTSYLLVFIPTMCHLKKTKFCYKQMIFQNKLSVHLIPTFPQSYVTSFICFR